MRKIILAACTCFAILGPTACKSRSPYETDIGKVAYDPELRKYDNCVVARILALNAPSESVELVVDAAMAGCSTDSMKEALDAANFDPDLALVCLLNMEAVARRVRLRRC
jgi:hypothetical protein